MKKKIYLLLVMFLFTNLFAVGQQIINQESNIIQLELIPNVNSDDSAYDDPSTLEFCFKDDNGRKLCLYHNIRK